MKYHSQNCIFRPGSSSYISLSYPPIRLTTNSIEDKFEMNKTVQKVHSFGRPWTWTSSRNQEKCNWTLFSNRHFSWFLLEIPIYTIPVLLLNANTSHNILSPNYLCWIASLAAVFDNDKWVIKCYWKYWNVAEAHAISRTHRRIEIYCSYRPSNKLYIFETPCIMDMSIILLSY